jgi:alkylhydroperoxidase/carboxymuconolactone decarboxylase family protein YurZ
MEDSVLDFEEKMWRLLELSRERMPELNESSYGGVSKTVYAEGAIDTKTKRLMSLAVAISMGGTLAWSKAMTVFEYLRERGLI